MNIDEIPTTSTFDLFVAFGTNFELSSEVLVSIDKELCWRKLKKIDIHEFKAAEHYCMQRINKPSSQ